MTAGGSVTLFISSDIRLVNLVHQASESVAELAGFDGDEALDVGLAVREAVINAIRHGNREDPKLAVQITLEPGVGSVRAAVLDRGHGFDPAAMADPTTGENLLRTSGRGLLLMRAFVDEVHFRRPAGGGTEVILIKRRETTSDDGPTESRA